MCVCVCVCVCVYAFPINYDVLPFSGAGGVVIAPLSSGLTDDLRFETIPNKCGRHAGRILLTKKTTTDLVKEHFKRTIFS